MSTGNKILPALFAGAGGIIAAYFGHAAHWLYWPVPLAVAAGADLIIAVWPGPRTPSSAEASADDSYMPRLVGPHREDAVRGVRLQSLTPDYDFLFSATVRWRPIDAAHAQVSAANANPGALAATAIIERARAVVMNEYPEFHPEAQNRLATALGHTLPDPTGRVEACAINVLLTVPPEDLDRVTQFTRLRKEAELWALRRKFEQERRSYFTDDVFKNTGSAVVWMLAQEEHSTQDIHRTVGMIGPLARLSAAANETEVSELYRDLAFPPGPVEPEQEEPDPSFDPVVGDAGPGYVYGTEAPGQDWATEAAEDSLAEHVASVIRDFVADNGSEHSTAFGKRMARAFEGVDLPDTAQRIRDTFGLGDAARTGPSPTTPDAPDAPDAPDTSDTSDRSRVGAADDRLTWGPDSEPGLAGSAGNPEANPTTGAEQDAGELEDFDPWNDRPGDTY